MVSYVERFVGIHKVTCMESDTASGKKYHVECDCMRHWRLGNCHHALAAMARSIRFPEFKNLSVLVEPMEDNRRPGQKRKRGKNSREKDPDSPGQVDLVDVQAEAKKRNVSTKGSRNMVLQRIGAHAVRSLATGASSSGGGAGSSAGGAGGAGSTLAQAPQLPQQATAQPESKPQFGGPGASQRRDGHAPGRGRRHGVPLACSCRYDTHQNKN